MSDLNLNLRSLLFPMICMIAIIAGRGLHAEILTSGRLEIIEYYNAEEPVRQGLGTKNRFYLSNVYLNVEGVLSDRANFIVEFMPITSDLYLLGGFATIADSLEGIKSGARDGENENVERKKIRVLAKARLKEVSDDANQSFAERVQLELHFDRFSGIKLGRIRNPFGFWDDYSLFRNLSALKTDPLSLGVSLRRTDLGLIAFGRMMDGIMSIEAGVLNGENGIRNGDSNRELDSVWKVSFKLKGHDFGVNGYMHSLPEGKASNALGLFFRLSMGSDFTILGEGIHIRNGYSKISTKGFYFQGVYDFSDFISEGLRWNFFIEEYASDLLKVDLPKDLDYKWGGTTIQASSGFLYAFDRNIDIGFQLIHGKDEEGDNINKFAAKADVHF